MAVAAPERRFDRSRLRLGLVIAAIAGAIAFLAIQGLGSATTYFYNVDEIVSRRADLTGDRLRLQGTPTADPATGGETIAFDLEYACEVVPVVHRGDPPELFRPGTPVVLEGEFDAAGTFLSDTIRVRHTSEYREANGAELQDAAADATETCP